MTGRSRRYFQAKQNRKDIEAMLTGNYARDDDDMAWLCHCGNYVEDGLHCDLCGAEPPWGYPCEGCQSAGWGEEEDEDEDYWDDYDCRPGDEHMDPEDPMYLPF